MMTPDPHADSLRHGDPEKLYAIYKDQLQHENENLNQRIMWSVFSQATLFTAYITSLNAPLEAKNPYFGMMHEFSVWIIPSVGLMLSVLILPSIVSALVYMSYLRRRFETGLPRGQLDDLPPIDGHPWLRRISNITPFGLPCILLIAWVTILAYQAMIWLRPPPL